MRALLFLVALTFSAQAAEFKIVVDDDVAKAITWARERDNSCPCRDPKSMIESDEEWVQIEAGALLKALPRRKVQTEANDLATATVKAFDDAEAAKVK